MVVVDTAAQHATGCAAHSSVTSLWPLTQSLRVTGRRAPTETTDAGCLSFSPSLQTANYTWYLKQITEIYLNPYSRKPQSIGCRPCFKNPINRSPSRYRIGMYVTGTRYSKSPSSSFSSVSSFRITSPRRVQRRFSSRCHNARKQQDERR